MEPCKPQAIGVHVHRRFAEGQFRCWFAEVLLDMEAPQGMHLSLCSVIPVKHTTRSMTLLSKQTNI